jgi:hypothetical protein
LGYYDGWTVTLDNNYSVGNVITNTGAKTVLIGCQASTMQDALNLLSFGVGSSGYNWYVLGSGSPYAASSVLAVSAVVSAIPTSLTNSPDMKFLFREGLLSELSRVARNANMTDAVLSVDANGLVSFDTSWASSYDLLGYAPLAGATFSGKVTTTQSATRAGLRFLNLTTYPTTGTAEVGDMWLTEYNLQYKDNTGTVRTCVLTSGSNTFTSPQVFNNQSNQTLPAVRINNLATTATAHSLVVEDSNNPDTTSFIVNNAGVVGINVNPATWTPSGVVFDVYGKATFTPANINTPSLNLGATASASSPTSAVNGDIWITNAASPKLAYKTAGVNYYPAVANQFNTFSAGIAITGASATNPQLAVTQTGQGVAVQITTQTGSGHALVVEDQTSPDTDSFVVNASGSVGIGVTPATWSPSRKLEVNGAISCSTIAASADSDDVATTAHVKSVIRGQVISDSSNYYTLTGTVQPNTIIKKLDDGSSTAMAINVDTNAAQGIPIGTQFVLIQAGLYSFTVQALSGVTINSSGGKYKSSGQHSVCTLIKVDTDVWYLAGDLIL